MAPQQLALRSVRLEFGCEHSHGDAGRTIDAAWTIGDRLTAAEADPAERLVKFARMPTAQFRENLPLHLARQIRTRRRIGHKEFGKAKRCAQPGYLTSKVSDVVMRPVNAEEKSLDAPFSTDDVACPDERQTNQSSKARSTRKPARSRRATTSS